MSEIVDQVAELETENARWRGLTEAVQQITGEPEGWPSHGNAPLAIAAKIQIMHMENKRLAAFARQIIEYAFDGHDADGGSIQALALAHGLLRQEVYDPEKHGPSLEAEPGDEWFVCVGAVAHALAE